MGRVMADDARTVQDRRRALLRRRINESGLAAEQSVIPQAVRAGERYPLSPGQRRMWFLQAMDAGDVTLNVCVAYRLTGPLDGERLRAAFHDLVARHAILRTVYGVDSEGEPYQVISGDVEIGWPTVDLTEFPEAERARRSEALARAEFGRPFDLATDLPLRTTLIHSGTGESVLLLVIHHICWDDDCWAVFSAELSAAYNGDRRLGDAPQFVAAEVLQTAAESTVADVGYWADTLRPAPEPLPLPGLAATRPSRDAERLSRVMSPELFDKVQEFAQRQSATPFMVLLAAFGVLVRRYTGTQDFLVSVPVTGRRAAAHGALGYFGNTLLLRITVRPQDTFVSFVDAIRETCLNGFAHQSVGIDRVVREVNPERMGHDGMDRLVRLGFSLRKSANDFALDGITVAQLDLAAVSAHLPLALAIVLDPGRVCVEVEYQTWLRGELVEQMLAHYLRLLDHALAEPGRRIAGIDMLGPGERADVLAQSHGELVTTPATTMVALLEAAADAAPEAVALVSDEARLTYAELHRRANRLARLLVRRGFGPEDIVGLRMTTSIDFVVAVLAVLKAGAAYLPIDPAYPHERIDYLIADARPRTVIGHREFVAAERDAARLPNAMLTDADRIFALHPEHLAYVIYTSGSTGRPKGVAVSHRAIAEHVDGFIAEWSMTAADRLLQSSSVSFDASLLDIFVTLTLGAQLVVPRPGAFGDIDYVADLIERHRVTVLHMVPSMLSTLLLLPRAAQWRALRHVPVGGEALPGEVADRFAGHFDAELRNHYGPTEAVVCATHRKVEGAQGSRVVPIGVPNRNVYAYVLDEELQPVPAQVIGELYLGGAQLARGYLGRPGLTSERFVADPFAAGMRMYRTGDLFRRNLSGELEFVGRADEQVKVRGYRIELGEVESVIAAHPAVRHCLVIAEDTEAGPTLAAYLVPTAGCGPSGALAGVHIDEIRAHAAAALPDYMVPSAFGVIPEIPLTVSGKLDKRALPAPTPVAARGHRQPTTEIERRMCAIFARLFGRDENCDRIGADESFFGLGGHSLLAARLVAQIRTAFAVECSVRDVFDAPTPAGLAGLIERLRTGSRPADTRPQLTGETRPARPPVSYSQLAMWFQYRMRGANDVFNMALTLRFTGPLDTRVLTAALNDVVARHEVLRTNLVEHNGMPYQYVHPELRLEPAVTEVAADRLGEAIAALRRHVFALESEPLIRPTLLVAGPDTHVLLLLIHHAVTDHTSFGILVDDLVVAYRARRNAQPPQWTAPPAQFADYAHWQRNTFESPGPWARAELDYWRGALEGLPTDISVATDRARPPLLGKRGEVVDFTVAAARRAALVRLAEESGTTEFSVYQAVLAVVLHKLGGGTDIAIGSPVACRVGESTANLTGPCANVVVLRTDLSGQPSLRELVARSRDTVKDALAHQEFPIERLVEALNPPRTPSRNHPLFQQSIHFRGEDWALLPRDLTGAGDTTVSALPMDFEISLLDLNVGVNVTPDAELDVRVVANADLYEPATVRRVAAALDAAFDAFATTPDASLASVGLLPAADLQALLAQPILPEARARPLSGGSAETERALTALLEELLEITGVHREDNFFAVGGDSIVAVQLAARATAAGLPLTAAMVFEHMSIAELAAAVDAATDQPVPQHASAPEPPESPESPSAPMSASGLDEATLAELTASWLRES